MLHFASPIDMNSQLTLHETTKM